MRWEALSVLPEDDRLWILIWLGPFYFMPGESQRRVQGYLVPIPYSEGKAPSKINKGRFPKRVVPGFGQRVEFAEGDLAALHPGVTFRNRKPVRSRKSWLSPLSWYVGFERQSPLRLEDKTSVLTPENTLLGNAWETLSHSACVKLSGGGLELIVPVTEVLRWCYATSSRMLQAVLSGEIKDLVEQVAKGGVLENGTYTMTLPEGFAPEDAPLFALLALDPVARKAAVLVNRQVVTGKHPTERGGFRFPKVTFPYTGRYKIESRGRWLDKTTFLVWHITGLEITPPFKQVALQQTRVAASSGNEGEPAPEQVQTRRRRVRDSGKVAVHSNVEPRDNRHVMRLPGAPAQWTGLVPVVQKDDGTVDGEHRTIIPHFLPHDRNATTGLGRDPQSQVSRAVIMAEEGVEKVNDELFAELRAALLLLELEHQELPINNPGGDIGLLKPGQNNMRCLVAELRHGNHHVYLLEKARSTEVYGPLLMATRTGGGQATAAQLADLIGAWTKERKWPSEWPGWQLVRVAHNYTSTQSFAHGLRRRVSLLLSSPSA